jgi:hypothetical protein
MVKPAAGAGYFGNFLQFSNPFCWLPDKIRSSKQGNDI